MVLTSHLQQAYEQQYANHQSEWRAIGARQKVRNIAEMLEGLNIRTMLEVGAGDGSLLQLLNDCQLAEDLYGSGNFG